MSLKKALATAAIAGGVLLAGAVAAQAAPGYATSNVNVRSGPGTGYAAVDVLQRGDPVDIQECRGSWCFVSKPGPDGWVSANYLSRSGGGWDRPVPPRPPVYYPPRPPVYNPPRPPIWNRPPPPPVWGAPRPPGPGWGGRPPRPDWRNDRSSVCFGNPNASVCVNN